jgi:hypothetical protein
MNEYLKLYAALEAIAAGDMDRESMIQTAREALANTEVTQTTNQELT